jgi:hypothetical protein
MQNNFPNIHFFCKLKDIKLQVMFSNMKNGNDCNDLPETKKYIYQLQE